MRPAELVLALGLLALAPAAAAVAQDADATPPAAPQEGAAPDDAAPDDAAPDDAAPEATYLFTGEPVVVTGELPFIPTSNTIASKLPLPLRETPASVSVVPGSLLEEQGATILGDALRDVSGLNVQTGNGVYDFFVVRGFDSVSSGLILSDGAPELETTFYQLYNV